MRALIRSAFLHRFAAGFALGAVALGVFHPAMPSAATEVAASASDGAGAAVVETQ